MYLRRHTLVQNVAKSGYGTPPLKAVATVPRRGGLSRVPPGPPLGLPSGLTRCHKEALGGAISATEALEKGVLTWFLEAVSSPAADSPLPCPFLKQKVEVLCLTKPAADANTPVSE